MINRDGNSVSLWQTVRENFQSMHYANAGDRFDVIIAGGGLTGITTALLLQEAGKSCLVLEGASLAFGTTGGTTAHLNTIMDTPYTTITKNFNEHASQLIASAAAEAISLVKSNIDKYNIDCGFSDAEAVMFSQDEKEDKELDQILEATNKAGVAATLSPDNDCKIPFVRAMRIPGQAKFHPVKYLYGIASAFEKAGGIIMEHCRVDKVTDGEPVEVHTSRGGFFCTDLIYATHIPPGINLLHLRCAPWRSYAIAVKLADDAYPPSLIYDMKDPYYYYRTQEIDGERYLIAGGEDHKTGEVEETGQCLLHLEAHVRKYFEVTEVCNRWSSQYFEPTDGIPYIGELPGFAKHILVGTGYGGNGMIYSNVAAMVFRSILTGQETEYTRLFSPSRVKPVAGFTNFITHNADVVKNFAGKILSPSKLEELAELAPGEGRLVSYEHTKLGIYKDDKGGIHAVDPTCKHMGCSVKWNASELSWDCPCHGARYSYEGKVVTGPAESDLEKIEVEQLVSK